MNLLRRLFYGVPDNERMREADALRVKMHGSIEADLSEIRDLSDKLSAELAAYIERRVK